jgi:hypothetical protein
MKKTVAMALLLTVFIGLSGFAVSSVSGVPAQQYEGQDALTERWTGEPKESARADGGDDATVGRLATTSDSRNDDIENATTVSEGTYTGLTLAGDDQDYYAVDVS